MPLDIPAGERCFVDANILYYCFVETPPLSEICRQFLRRVQNEEVSAHTDARALSDCAHKTMLAEVSEKYGRPREQLIGWLKQHPESVADLPKTVEVCGRLPQLKINVVSNESCILPTVIALAQKYHLLIGDATIVAQMQFQGITHLATNDADFDRVPGIMVWKPRE